MTFTIDCVATEAGWMYRVVLWRGSTSYVGVKEYKRHGDAVRAAKSTGAKPDPNAD